MTNCTVTPRPVRSATISGPVNGGPSQSVHEATRDGVAVADVARQLDQGRALGAALAADGVGERFVDLAEGEDLPVGVVFDAKRRAPTPQPVPHAQTLGRSCSTMVIGRDSHRYVAAFCERFVSPVWQS